jgi:large subunit ribosomal protein L6e
MTMGCPTCYRTRSDSINLGLTIYAVFQMARSNELVPGVGRFSRSAVYARRALYKGQKKSEKPASPEVALHTEKQVGGDKNGGTRLVPTTKPSRYYPAEDVRQPKKSRKSPKPTKLRSSITPGTVLILLAGRFRGKRVVFLKQLESGLLLVTGPYKINGVPLRRVNQAYVIATSTRVDLSEYEVSSLVGPTSHSLPANRLKSRSDLKVGATITDLYFAKPATKGPQSAEAEFFEGGKPKSKAAFPEAKSTDQKEIDTAVVTAIKRSTHLTKYLQASWGLSKGQYPHQLVF